MPYRTKTERVRRLHGRVARQLTIALMLSVPLAASAQVTYTFTNTEAEPHNTWDSGNNWATALEKEVVVSGVPTSGQVLRQIRVDLGSSNGSNIVTLQARLTDPAGNTIDVFQNGYFFDTPNSRYVNITLRDHPLLKRLDEYTNSYLGMPYSFGYYRVAEDDGFSTLNTTDAVNGTWSFSMIENTGTEIQFNSVSLVFGPPFEVVDITAGTANASCAQPRCIQSGAGQVVLATNINYPQGQPNYPALTLGGCNWNAQANNTAWFRFIPTAATVQLSVSGFGNNVQQTVVLRNDGTCAAPQYALVACPTSMFVNDCNSPAPGDPVLYHRLCYDGGSKFNHGYTLTGLTVGQEYLLLVDGQDASEAQFLVELANGADNTCPLEPDLPVIVDVITTDSGCDDDAGSITIIATGTDLVYSIDGGANFSTDNVFEGLAAGTYTILIMDANGEMSGTTATVAATEVPVIVAVETSQPDCAGGLGSIAVTATGTDLLYSIDGGATFQDNGFFLDLEAGTYDLVVINAAGCTATQTVELTVVGAPVINSVEVVAPVCAGDANGSISVVASGTPAFTYSIDGGATFQADALFSNVPAGTYTLVVEDADGCSTTQEVVVADPPPVQADLVTVLSENCSGLCDGTIYVVSFAATTYALDDGPTQEEGLWVALCPGSYTVFLANDLGCTADTTVVIGDGAVVVAGFTADPLDPTPGTSIAFTNTSEGAATYIWDFGGLDISLEEEPFYNFPEGLATLEVCLTATDTAGCFDVYCEVITASPEVEFTVPNIFSPNGDGVNDIFGVTGNPGALSSFSLEVFNRFGQLLFSGDRIGMAWDGRTFAGEPASEGTYFWVLRFQVSGSAAEERSGHLTLVR